MRVRVGNYNNTSATYVHVANMKVTQVDAQSVIKMVQTGVSYSGVEVTASNGVECTSTIGGKTAIVKLNATDGLAFYDDTTYRGGLEVIGTDLFLTANALKGTESATRYLLWEDAPGVSGSPNLQMYDAGSRVGELSVSEISVGLAGIPQTALDYSEAYLSARSYGANPDNFSNIILYGNKGNSNYAQINVSGDVYDSSQDYSEFLIKNSSLSFFINDVSHFAVSASALTYKTYSIWHSGNDGSGSTLDADTVDGEHSSGFALNDPITVGSGYTVSSGIESVYASLPLARFTSGYYNLNGQGYWYAGAKATSTYGSFIAQRYQGSLYFVENAAGVWSHKKIWYEDNDGSGSGLDADTLDTFEATEFFRKRLTPLGLTRQFR